MVSVPPRPSVVISFSVETPWKPATTQTLPAASASRTRSPLTSRILALPCDGVGDDPDLAAGEAHGVDAEVGERHAQQRHRHPLAGGQQHVHLAARQGLRDVVGELDQVVGRLAHRRHGDHDVVAVPLRERDVLGDGPHPVGVGDRRAAELLDDEGHGDQRLPVGASRSAATVCARSTRVQLSSRGGSWLTSFFGAIKR